MTTMLSRLDTPVPRSGAPSLADETPRRRSPPRNIHLAVIGASGRVGRRVIDLIARQQTVWRAGSLDVRIVAAANSRRTIVASGGIATNQVVDRLVGASASAAIGFHHAMADLPRPLLVLDCSASAQVVAQYPAWLGAGIDIVTPNKLGPSANTTLATAIDEAQRASGARLFDSTTVGAQLPLLPTLRELARAGDRCERFEAMLSGTLSYVLGRMQQGESLSAAVRGAIAEGYSEPHPARDLSGEDAARKLVILLRALGHRVELENIDCVPLVDARLLAEPDPHRLLANLSIADETWRARIAIAQARQERWVYRASFDASASRGHIARIAPERVSLEHPLAHLAPCENKLILHSAFYRAAPLCISGPGAGIDLTAAGVLGDLQIALQRYAVAQTGAIGEHAIAAA